MKTCFLPALLLGMQALSACQLPASPSANPALGSAVLHQQQTAFQQTPNISLHFAEASDLPPDLLARFSASVQHYADEVSRRRQLDFFTVPSHPVGLRLRADDQEAWLLSYLGTAQTRNDLNVEIRLLSGQNQALSLNYSGPVTRLGAATLSEPEAAIFPSADSLQGNPFRFELISGLPGQGITEAYGQYLDGLGQSLRQRYSSRPIQFDDGPLIYAVHHQETLLGFVFINTRNVLVLGERKYADLQSVVMVGTQRQILGSYTLVAFNPKTAAHDPVPDYRIEPHPRWGTLIECGEW